MVTPMNAKQLSNIIKSGGRIPDKALVPKKFILKCYKNSWRKVDCFSPVLLYVFKKKYTFSFFKETANYKKKDLL